MYSNNFKSLQDHSLSKDKLIYSLDSLNTQPKSKQKQILQRFYQTQNFSKLINQGQKKLSTKKEVFSTNIILNTTLRNVTPKINHINQEYYFSKQQQLQTTVRQPEKISKTLQSVLNKPNQNFNQEYSNNKIGQINTDRKHNLISLNSTKLIQKRKTENQEQTITKEKNNYKLNSPLLISLEDVVTQVTTQNLSKSKISPFEQAKSLSPPNKELSLKKKNNIYYVSAMCESMIDDTNPMSQIFQDHAIQTFNSINFCLNQQEKDLHQIQEKMIKWPKQNTKFNKTIVFDLDETLIHCYENNTTKPEILLPITFPSGEIVIANINVRPWAKEILLKLSEVCEVVIFTASHKCYAQQVIELLDKFKIIAKSQVKESILKIFEYQEEI
ncbi:unnamed protein product [Paramecium sonneborni]|uniref:Mitochondrial import inner membrane translocase subunit TIM50 n=1 Tax=Paramecium sonneborni TaxID=65129 RepID=A0A8S1MIA6_9CILI|nr:unnamed protein product [Paramecium sonneborni]